MSTDAPNVRVDRITLTAAQIRTTEILLYQMADMIDRLLAAGVQYTKVVTHEVPR